jgi:hypothetical protein
VVRLAASLGPKVSRFSPLSFSASQVFLVFVGAGKSQRETKPFVFHHQSTDCVESQQVFVCCASEPEKVVISGSRFVCFVDWSLAEFCKA